MLTFGHPSLANTQPGKWIKSAPPRHRLNPAGLSFFVRSSLGFLMDGYTFYPLPSSASGRQFSPAMLPSDEVAIARATAALRDSPITREVAIWKGYRFVANVSKDRRA